MNIIEFSQEMKGVYRNLISIKGTHYASAVMYAATFEHLFAQGTAHEIVAYQVANLMRDYMQAIGLNIDDAAVQAEFQRNMNLFKNIHQHFKDKT